MRNRLCSGTLLLLALSTTARGQNVGRPTDSSGVRARTSADSANANSRNWFVSLMRKIARKSDEVPGSDESASVASPVA